MVCSNAVCSGSSLRVILKFLPLINQNAGEIISLFSAGSMLFPIVEFTSYHQAPDTNIQFLESAFENRAIKIHPVSEPFVLWDVPLS